MAVTLMPFVRLPKAHTSARVKQALKEMENTAKVMCLLCIEIFGSFLVTKTVCVSVSRQDHRVWMFRHMFYRLYMSVIIIT